MKTQQQRDKASTPNDPLGRRMQTLLRLVTALGIQASGLLTYFAYITRLVRVYRPPWMCIWGVILGC